MRERWLRRFRACFMSGNPHLNGTDYLMLGFDHELRRRGFAGYSCQIVLELKSAISPARLQERLQIVTAEYPIVNARPGGLFLPRWKIPGRPQEPRLRIHRDESRRCEAIVNKPLAARDGELTRFDLIERDGGKMRLVFTWAHALMDAVAAENFLAIVGHPEMALPSDRPPAPGRPKSSLPARFKLARKNIYQLDKFCEAPPRSSGFRFGGAAPTLQHRVESFSLEETARIRANAVRLCGMLGDAQYHAAVSVMELHRLHQRLGCASASYVLPVPVGLRPKGAMEPLFSNQIAMLMIQFLPENLDTIEHAVSALKTQTQEAMRNGLLESGLMLSELFRFLPLPIYMAMVKQGLRGEICSLFYGDTASVNPLLTNFLGVEVEDFAHIGAVTPSPGVGVIYYYFRGELRATVLSLAPVLNESEAAEFAANLRARLLSP
jgi:hypothetical protein